MMHNLTEQDSAVVGYLSGRVLFCKEHGAADMQPYHGMGLSKKCFSCGRSILTVYLEQMLER